jgi:hypothetical protein
MSEYKACPQCQSTDVAQVSFTWWGGVLGPKLLNHVQCCKCGTTFNGKTGASNTTGIVIYSIIVFALAMVIAFLLIR